MQELFFGGWVVYLKHVSDVYILVEGKKSINAEKNENVELTHHICQQNKHIPLKKMIIRTTFKAVNCVSNVARVKYSIVTSRLNLHLLLLRW